MVNNDGCRQQKRNPSCIIISNWHDKQRTGYHLQRTPRTARSIAPSLDTMLSVTGTALGATVCSGGVTPTLVKSVVVVTGLAAVTSGVTVTVDRRTEVTITVGV